MIAQFFDLEDATSEFNGTKVGELAQFLAILRQLRHRDPFVAELVGENGNTLSVGISTTCGSAQFSSTDGAPPYWVALAHGRHDLSTEGMEFLIGGTPTPILKRHCLAIEAVNQIVDHFLTTGDRSPAVSWEEA
jgi:Immunity protein Imm1